MDWLKSYLTQKNKSQQTWKNAWDNRTGGIAGGKSQAKEKPLDKKINKPTTSGMVSDLFPYPKPKSEDTPSKKDNSKNIQPSPRNSNEGTKEAYEKSRSSKLTTQPTQPTQQKSVQPAAAKGAFNNAGMQADQIRAMQQMLVDAGYGNILGKVDGMWGIKSAAALQQYQKDQAIRNNTMAPMGVTKPRIGGFAPNTTTLMKKGGKADKKHWIQDAVNPAHKGYCTPMTKSTCTPKRAALARTFKKMAKHENGGQINWDISGILSKWKK